MADAYLNATCRLLKPRSAQAPGDALQRERGFETLPEQRCSCRDLSAMRSVGVLGAVSLNGWTVRLQTRETPAPGWRVQVLRDGNSEWDELVVAKATRAHHWVLTCQGATG